jgi:hypothetical protein
MRGVAPLLHKSTKPLRRFRVAHVLASNRRMENRARDLSWIFNPGNFVTLGFRLFC